jgi:preprotein translocase subunit SecF
VKTALGSDVASYRRTEFVGPKVGGELIEAGILAVVLSLLAIMVYVWFRFEWQFSVGAIVALTHDVISTIGVFSINEHEFNLATVAAILTIAGYSINDTVVVFDRIRENLRKYKTMPIHELLNLSLNQTLSRTLLTSITTLLALLAIFFFGGAVIQDFAFALIWGVVIGTYSSIFVAAPVVMMLNIRQSISGGTVGGSEAGQETPAE